MAAEICIQTIARWCAIFFWLLVPSKDTEKKQKLGQTKRRKFVTNLLHYDLSCILADQPTQRRRYNSDLCAPAGFLPERHRLNKGQIKQTDCHCTREDFLPLLSPPSRRCCASAKLQRGENLYSVSGEITLITEQKNLKNNDESLVLF